MTRLFQDFDPVSYNEWITRFKKDLKTDDPEAIINSELCPGLKQPAYCDHTTPYFSRLNDYHHSNINNDQNYQGARAWAIMEPVSGPDLNRSALDALNGGAEGLEFSGTHGINWEQALKGVSIPHIIVGLRTKVKHLEPFCQELSKESEYRGYAIVEDLTTELEGMVPDLLEKYPNGLKFLTLEAVDQKPGSLAELSRLLVKVIFIINHFLDAGLPLDVIVNNIQLRVRVGDHYLWEICRFRAIRILFHQMIMSYGLKEYPPDKLTIHAITAMDEKGEWQMLRNTTQSMAAVLGGCDLLTVTRVGSNRGKNSKRDTRIARNVGLILREEGQLHRVADPAAGSYYLASLTERILRKVWLEVQEAEKHGGYLHLKSDHETQA